MDMLICCADKTLAKDEPHTRIHVNVPLTDILRLQGSRGFSLLFLNPILHQLVKGSLWLLNLHMSVVLVCRMLRHHDVHLIPLDTRGHPLRPEVDELVHVGR